jgi:hypothetical protein
MFSFRRTGQGATEYLVILAVVLIIALVSIALLGFFPGISSDARITQSQSYWKAATPFAITAYSLNATTGDGIFIIQNMDVSGQATLTGSYFGSASNVSMTQTFAPGEARTLTLKVPTGTAGQVYDLSTNFTYTTSFGATSKQYGVKTLTGKYN